MSYTYTYALYPILIPISMPIPIPIPATIKRSIHQINENEISKSLTPKTSYNKKKLIPALPKTRPYPTSQPSVSLKPTPSRPLTQDDHRQKNRRSIPRCCPRSAIRPVAVVQARARHLSTTATIRPRADRRGRRPGSIPPSSPVPPGTDPWSRSLIARPEAFAGVTSRLS